MTEAGSSESGSRLRVTARTGKRRQRGLTLVETLVALAILAGVVIAAYSMIAQSVRFASIEQERLIANIVADNQIAEAMLRAAPPSEGEEEAAVEAAGRSWTVKRVVAKVGEDFIGIDVSVTRAGDAQVLARVQVLRPKP